MKTTGRLAIGDLMPDVELRDLDGQPRRLSDFRGRPLLIFMWASW
jgi:peroxiredoxin